MKLLLRAEEDYNNVSTEPSLKIQVEKLTWLAIGCQVYTGGGVVR